MMAISSVLMKKRNRQYLWQKFVYSRGPIGDVEVWAETKEEAARTMHQYGFTSVTANDVVGHGNGAVVAAAVAKLTEKTL